MILNLTKSKLFTLEPDIRFSKEYALPKGTWLEVWRRYKLLGYSNSDIRDYIFIKHIRNLSHDAVERWIIRSEIYDITGSLVKKGVVHVNSEIFGKWEQNVMNELLKTVRAGASANSKSII